MAPLPVPDCSTLGGCGRLARKRVRGGRRQDKSRADDSRDASRVANIRKRIRLQQHQVGHVSGVHPADTVGDAEPDAVSVEMPQQVLEHWRPTPDRPPSE